MGYVMWVQLGDSGPFVHGHVAVCMNSNLGFFFVGCVFVCICLNG